MCIKWTLDKSFDNFQKNIMGWCMGKYSIIIKLKKECAYDKIILSNIYVV